jgi:hypothetical protein
VTAITELSGIIAKKNETESSEALVGYLTRLFKLKLDKETEKIVASFLRLRIRNKIDREELEKRLDAPKRIGGAGMHSVTADKISREVEIIMLMKYS